MYGAAYSRNTDRAAKAYLARKAAEQQQAKNLEYLERIAASAKQEPIVAEYDKIHIRDAGDTEYEEEPRVTFVNQSKFLVREVAEEYGLTYQDLVGAGRSKQFIFPRRLAMWRLRHERGLSLPRIGQIFNRDHTTCLHSIQLLDAMHARGELILSDKQAA
ncbi:helix-turn-helix domain-containing protein [Brucella anthropi]|uniref:helix-turn-helix domain-containing protein n=1 Tax=Brucella anthropi TaxID=529 RepID=UPI00028801ED|nr:helix-turn-helix domain-containing protein [Brucella anthropi]